MRFNKQRVLTVAKIILPIILIAFIFYQGQNELRSLSLKESIRAIQQIPSWKFILLIVSGLAAVATMFFYDFFLLRSLQVKVPIGLIFRASWIANSFNGIIGFGGLAGMGVRTALYRPFVEGTRLLKAIGWMAPTLISGLSILSALSLLNVFPAFEVLDLKKWLWPVIIGVAFFFPVYLLFTFRRGSSSIRPSSIALYSLVSLAEWFSAGVVVYFILAALGTDVSFSKVIGVFIIAATAGLISMVPGGFGSFDLVFLIGMQRAGVEEGIVLTGLLIYRLVYYLIPFVIGVIFSAREFSGPVVKMIEDKPIVGPSVEVGGVIWRLQLRFLSKVRHFTLALITLLAGIAIWGLAILPPNSTQYEYLEARLPHELLLLANSFFLMAGLLYVLLAPSLYRRTKRSLYMIYGVSAFALIGMALRGFNLISLSVVLIVLVLVTMSRSAFHRERTLITTTRLIRAAFAGFLYLGGFIFFGYAFYTLGSADGTKVYPAHEIFMFAASAAIFALVYTLVFIRLFNTFNQPVLGEKLDLQKVKDVLTEEGGNYLSHLAFLGDKRFFFSESGRSFIQFSQTGNRIMMLGDPSGNPEEHSQLIACFLRRVEDLGYIPNIYQIQAQNMSLYHDFGFNFFKLGEEAIVDMTTFTVSGKKRAGLRSIKNRFEREGMTFEVVSPPFSEALLDQLRDVSDEWLGGKSEKGFSLGYFNESYLNQAPIGIMRDANQQMLGFMTFMPAYQEGVLSIDLMRFRPDGPNGIMDAMFIRLFDYATEQGYHTFNMGMAPLSSVGEDETSFWQERVAADVFNNIRYMYSFTGLRRYKEKYDPKWEGRYLAYRKRQSLTIAILKATRLISKKKDRILLP
ncbi:MULTISPECIES: bifunctional lysylphosphatidylglycerol flippase/synthetase MprF [unclassified Exiguobacterium]|uniref:bifunctional lysylphosphatidylglycerol flippase/synthetase MprF n=1 Tax=unclassified Exiguobacterium TaxID=2644629 RepID=UPI000DF83DA9|nr:bifunctional lysylphosphatidylglycerol flippase/synthetase MprF [Exiguobacterium sp. RIT594]RDB32789.1 bifunctional lysylphosphatidylglycerol flippase/synthetase MprF [Exiguobacterium sp. RIT594]